MRRDLSLSKALKDLDEAKALAAVAAEQEQRLVVRRSTVDALLQGYGQPLPAPAPPEWTPWQRFITIAVCGSVCLLAVVGAAHLLGVL